MLSEATGGLVSRPEGFVIYLSTQSNEQPAGVFKTKLDYFRNVRDGVTEDPKSIGMLYEFPTAMVESEAYLDSKNFWITNPNMGRSVSADWITDEFRKKGEAGEGPVRTFLAKHGNVEIGTRLRSDGWPSAKYWDIAADKSISLDTLITGSISGQTLTVGTLTGPALAIGMSIHGTGVSVGTQIESGIGTTVSSTAMTADSKITWDGLHANTRGYLTEKAAVAGQLTVLDR